MTGNRIILKDIARSLKVLMELFTTDLSNSLHSKVLSKVRIYAIPLVLDVVRYTQIANIICILLKLRY